MEDFTLKKLLALFAVVMLSACGTEEPSANSRDEALETTESALSVCGWNSCPSGYSVTGYSCNSSCTTPPTSCSPAVTNQSDCIANTVYGFTACGGCPTTHYVSSRVTTTSCMINLAYPPAYTNAANCQIIPDGGTIEACGFCPSGWALVASIPSSDKCVNSGGYKDALMTCTK